MTQDQLPRTRPPGWGLPLGAGIGAGIGLVVGVLIEHLTGGMVVGAALGVVAGAIATTCDAAEVDQRRAILGASGSIFAIGLAVTLSILLRF